MYFFLNIFTLTDLVLTELLNIQKVLAISLLHLTSKLLPSFLWDFCVS